MLEAFQSLFTSVIDSFGRPSSLPCAAVRHVCVLQSIIVRISEVVNGRFRPFVTADYCARLRFCLQFFGRYEAEPCRQCFSFRARRYATLR